MKRHEKITYTNEIGESVEMTYSFPYFFISLEGADGLENNIYQTSGIGQDGVSVTGSNLQPRPLTLNGGIKGYSKTEVARHRNVLLKIFTPKSKGTLTYEYGEVKKKIDCHVEVAPRFQKVNEEYRMQEFKIDLLCPDPYWQDLEQDSIDLVTWIENLEFTEEGFSTEQSPNHWLGTEEGSIGFEEFASEFGLGQAKTFGYRELRQIIEIDNVGDAETPIRVIFKADGDVVNPFIQNILTYDKIQIKGTLRAGDELIITTGYGDKNVYLNGAKAQQYYDFLNSEWLQLQPGVNLIKYDAQEGINNLECRILYTSKYLGV